MNVLPLPILASVGLLLASAPAVATTCTNFDVDLGSTVGPSVATANTCGESNSFGSGQAQYPVSCGGSMGSPDLAYLFTAPSSGTYVFDTFGSSYDTGLQLRSEADCGQTELSCNDDTNGLQSQLQIDLLAGEEIFVVLDGYAGSACGAGLLNITLVGCLDADTDGVCDSDPADVCFGNDALGDSDNDGSCDDLDLCVGDDTTGDPDNDGVCTDNDVCLGNDATGDADGDGICNDRDDCLGDPAAGDVDSDGICNDLDTTCDLGEVDLGSAIGPFVQLGSTCQTGFDLEPENPLATCGFAGSGQSEEIVYLWTAPFTAQWAFTTFGSDSFDSVLHARSLADGSCPQLGCNDDFPGSRDASLVLDVAAGQTIAIAVDGFGIGCGDFQLSIVPTTNAGLVASQPLVPGTTATWTVVGARPGSDFTLYGSTRGTGTGPCPYPGVCLTLVQPFAITSTLVPPSGSFEIGIRVPPSAPSGLRVDFQGAYYNAARNAGGRTNRVRQTLP